MIVCLNGEFVDAAAAHVSIADRGLLHADGIFETALLRAGGFLRLRPHLDRFAASAATLRLPHPPLPEIERSARALAARNALEDGNLRITLTRGVRVPTLLLTLAPADPAAHERARRGWRVITATTRRPSTAAVPAQLKALGRTYALLARLEAADAGVDDALLLTDQGDVCEGPTWNIFWRRGAILCTPALDAGVLAGVTRAILTDVAPAAGFSVRTGIFPRAELDHADEIFATMTSVGIVPIRELDGRALPAATLAADALLPRYWDVVDREVAADRQDPGTLPA